MIMLDLMSMQYFSMCLLKIFLFKEYNLSVIFIMYNLIYNQNLLNEKSSVIILLWNNVIFSVNTIKNFSKFL